MTDDCKIIETPDNWSNVPDDDEIIYEGASLVSYDGFSTNPLITSLSGLEMIIWMFEDHKIKIDIFNPSDLKEGWRYQGPIPEEFTWTKLFKLFDKSADGRSGLQFNNGKRDEMRLVIWQKRDESVPLCILPFDAISDEVDILRIHASWDLARIQRDNALKQHKRKRKLDEIGQADSLGELLAMKKNE